MAPFPLPIADLFTKFGEFSIYLMIGFFFGFVLEISGFANSPKLAAQFYFKDMTVLKVMFTAIVVAMVLVFGTSAVGLLDYNLVWVPPTYLWPGILGGLIMGVGFIIGGFCPGTSLVALATRKLDGLFFTLGALFGILLFGETVDSYRIFWNSSYLGRFTIPEWLGLDTGVVVVAVVFMALFMFWGGEQLEKIFGGLDPKRAPRQRYGGALGLVVLAGFVAFLGQPTTADRWAKIAPEKELLLNSRAVQVSPGELMTSMQDRKLRLLLLDVRDEVDYNLFHISNAKRVDLEDLPGMSKELLLEPDNTVFITLSNDEVAATEAWKILAAESVPNIYILEGGINNWLSIFADDEQEILTVTGGAADQLRYVFPAALGSKNSAAYPKSEDYQLEFTPVIELKNKRGPGGGGCG
jgi:rhodanese-related sulfurtransferase